MNPAFAYLLYNYCITQRLFFFFLFFPLVVVVVVAQVVFLLHQLGQLETSQRVFTTLKRLKFLGLGQLPIAPALEQRLNA